MVSGQKGEQHQPSAVGRGGASWEVREEGKGVAGNKEGEGRGGGVPRGGTPVGCGSPIPETRLQRCAPTASTGPASLAVGGG